METESKIGSSVKDTSYTRNQEEEDEEGENQNPAGLVTESEEARERLGSDEDPSKEKTETESKVGSSVKDTSYTRKQEEEGEEGENQNPAGIVTESEEARERLGSDENPSKEKTKTESKVGSSVKDTSYTRKQEEEGEEGENQKPAGIVTESEEVRERLGSDEDPNREKIETESKIGSSVYTRKQEEEGEEGENQKPAGIVTESEEVRQRLGSDEDPSKEKTETESKVASNVSPTGKGYVESVKDSVTSWWSGGGAQKQDSEASPGKTHGEGERLSSSTGDGEKGVGERRLQECGN